MGGQWGKLTRVEYRVDDKSDNILPNIASGLIINGNVSALRKLVHIKKSTFDFHDGTTLLHVASLHHQKECLKFLLEKHIVPVNKTDHSYETALNGALVQSELFECADMLIAAGVNINVKNKWQRTPLLKAAIDHNEVAVCYLLDKGGNPNTEDCMGCTPLNQSAFYHLHRSFDKLLEHSVDINYVNKNGQTTLYFACKSLNKSAVFKLLHRGADVNIDLLKKIMLYFDHERHPSRRSKMEAILKVVISGLGQTISLSAFLKSIFLQTQLDVSKYFLACTNRKDLFKHKPENLDLYFKNKPQLLARCDHVPALKETCRLVVRGCLAPFSGNVIYACNMLIIPPGLKSVILLQDVK